MKTKHIILAVVCMLATACYAQDGTVRVNYKGARPTISDFAEAYFAAYAVDNEDDYDDEAQRASNCRK